MFGIIISEIIKDNLPHIAESTQHYQAHKGYQTYKSTPVIIGSHRNAEPCWIEKN